MLRSLFLALIFFSSTTMAAPSLVSFLSQKTNEIRNLEMCREASTRETRSLLSKRQEAQGCRVVPLFKKHVESLDDVNEQIFFDTAALRQIESMDCLLEQTNQFLEKPTSAAVESSRQQLALDYATKISKISQFNQELDSIEGELSEMARSEVSSVMGEALLISNVDEKHRKALRARQKKLQSAIGSIVSSVWQGGNHFVRDRILAEAKKKDYNPQKFITEFTKPDGANSFNALLAKMQNETATEKKSLVAKADRAPVKLAHFDLTDKDKIRLYKDQNWLKPSASESRAVIDTDGIMCRLDGRYGVGRDRFYTTVEVGSMVGLTLLPGGLYLAAGRGLIAVSAARTLGLSAALGISTTALAVTYEKNCPHSSLHASMQLSCQSPEKNLVTEIQYGNCALDVALASLDIPFPELKYAGLLVGSLKAGSHAKKAAGTAGETLSFVNPQIQIWKARATGQWAEAEKMEAAVRSNLEKAKMTEIDKPRIGESGPLFMDLQNGIQGVWKPAAVKGANGNAEVAVSNIDNFLGLDVVPMTVHREYQGTSGTLQLRATELKAVPTNWNPDELAVFDYLIGNKDRNPGNYLVSSDNKIVAIDHGVTFEGVPASKQIPLFEREVDTLSLINARRKDVEKQLQQKIKTGTNEASAEITELKRKLERDIQLENSAKKKVEKIASTIALPKEAVDKLRTANKQTWEKTVGKNLSDKQINELMQRQKHILNLLDRTQSLIGPSFYPARNGWPRYDFLRAPL